MLQLKQPELKNSQRQFDVRQAGKLRETRKVDEMDASQTMRELLVSRGGLNGDQIAGFVVGFILMAFFLLLVTAYSCTLSGRVGRLEARLDQVQAHAHEEEGEAGKLI